MPRPPINAIHQAEYQIKDFFNDEAMRRLYPKNPYNVLWFIEECLTKKQQEESHWIDFKNYVLERLKNNQYVEEEKNPLKNKMIEDELVLKRVKNIIELSNVNINSLCLATKVVRMGSDRLIKGLLELGLDPNVSDNKNSPLEVALHRKNMKIANVYWNHPLMNRYTINKNGENFAEIAIQYKQWKFLEIIIRDEPELVFGRNKNGNLNVENIIRLFNQQKLTLTEKDLEMKKKYELINKNSSFLF